VDLVCLIRSPVSVDYRGDVLLAHDPELGTRCIKQIAQIMRGSLALGMALDDAVALARRICRDSVPPQRLDVLHVVASEEGPVRVADVCRALPLPRTTAGRILDTLHALELLKCDEIEDPGGKTWWLNTRHYTLAPKVDRAALAALCPPSDEATGKRTKGTDTNDDVPF
jgi:hypothetical protein